MASQDSLSELGLSGAPTDKTCKTDPESLGSFGKQFGAMGVDPTDDPPPATNITPQGSTKMLPPPPVVNSLAITPKKRKDEALEDYKETLGHLSISSKKKRKPADDGDDKEYDAFQGMFFVFAGIF